MHWRIVVPPTRCSYQDWSFPPAVHYLLVISNRPALLQMTLSSSPSLNSFIDVQVYLNRTFSSTQRVKPPAVDEMRWRQALAAAGGPDNPDRLWPVLACGTRDLLARSQAQVGVDLGKGAGEGD